MKDNKLIAEFMGYTHQSDSAFKDENGFWNDFEVFETWNWLMPVINKIRSMDSTYEIEEVCKEEVGKYDWYNDISHYEFDLDLTYESVVEFIKEYNNN